MRAKSTAIVLAAGKGTRMGTGIKKQYMTLGGLPLVAHSLLAFEKSPLADQVVLVCGAGEEDWCREELVNRYRLSKVRRIVPGGKERYHSVWNGLQAAGECDVILVHDGARPFVTDEMLGRLLADVQRSGACVAAVPVKDTIKLADAEGFVKETLPRSLLWSIQTPQVFEYRLVKEAYQKLICWEEAGGGLYEGAEVPAITDDAMVVEQFNHHKVKLTEGSYDNIKVTTPEDLDVAERILAHGKR